MLDNTIERKSPETLFIIYPIKGVILFLITPSLFTMCHIEERSLYREGGRNNIRASESKDKGVPAVYIPAISYIVIVTLCPLVADKIVLREAIIAVLNVCDIATLIVALGIKIHSRHIVDSLSIDIHKPIFHYI